MVTCALCGFRYEPGGDACRAHGCPLVWSGCRIAHCPHCGYATPDAARGLAGWLKRLVSGEPATDANIVRLFDAIPGRAAVVDRVAAEPDVAARLTLLGLTPGTPISLQQRFPTFVVDVDGTEIALESAVARTIWVRPTLSRPAR
jgi:Fe2+ transport system protein FeoA